MVAGGGRGGPALEPVGEEERPRILVDPPLAAQEADAEDEGEHQCVVLGTVNL